MSGCVQDKINAFWEISKKELEDTKAQLRNKDREMEELEERHQVEIKVSHASCLSAFIQPTNNNNCVKLHIWLAACVVERVDPRWSYCCEAPQHACPDFMPLP